MPCADARREAMRGSALILALITVFLATSISAALIASLGRNIDTASALQDQRQARLLARGAVDWARNVLSDDKRRTNVDHLQELWAVDIPPLPVDDAGEEGEVAGRIQDRSGLFNLNTLVTGEKGDDSTRPQFARLLMALDVPEGQANALANRLQQALVPATQTAPDDGLPHSPLVDPLELASVPGFDNELIERLLPFVTALPAENSKINLNTAPPEILFAVTENLSMEAARRLSAEREHAWYRTVGEYGQHLPSGARLISQVTCDTNSRYFLVTARARSASATVSIEVLLDRTENWPTILWQKLL
ncbi:MAG: type II secretion system minor pseudopilin GspK [Rhodocyclaceae bacterium]|nr:type II secretion system minor pseudopilin GspK [Rhodocyclaceae bacterium]